MLTIKRTCTIKIITRALRYENRALIATLKLDAEDCEICEDLEQLKKRLQQCPELAIVYNQNTDAINLLADIETPLNQLFIEIRQDTKGVLGLHASYKNKNQSESMELISNHYPALESGDYVIVEPNQ